MKKLAFEIVVLLLLVGYIIIIETNIVRYPDSTTPLYVGIGIAILYGGLVLYSPRQIKLARWWAAVSIAAILYWGYLLVGILMK